MSRNLQPEQGVSLDPQRYQFRALLDVRREPTRPVDRTPRQRLNDVRAAYHRKRFELLLQALAGVRIAGELPS